MAQYCLIFLMFTKKYIVFYFSVVKLQERPGREEDMKTIERKVRSLQLHRIFTYIWKEENSHSFVIF